MAGPTMRSVDPEGLARLARLLDAAADDMAGVAARGRTMVEGMLPVPALERVADVVAWAHGAAGTARRTALLALSDGRDWRSDPGWLGHIEELGAAQLRGLRMGGSSLLRGAEAVAGMAVEPVGLGRAALEDGPAGLRDEVERDLQRHEELTAGMIGSFESTTKALIVDPALYPVHVEQDGFWRTTDELAEAESAQVPGLAAALLTDGAGEISEAFDAISGAKGVLGAARTVGANVYLGVGDFDPAYNGPPPPPPPDRADAEVAALSVPVAGDATHRVGLDFRTGDFMVARIGPSAVGVSEKRWSRLSGDERQALEEAGVTDGHGHLGEESTGAR